MPRVVFDDLKVDRLADGLSAITATLKNTRLIPSVAAQATIR